MKKPIIALMLLCILLTGTAGAAIREPLHGKFDFRFIVFPDLLTFSCPPGWEWVEGDIVEEGAEPDPETVGILLGEEDIIVFREVQHPGRRKPRDLADRTREEIQKYILDLTREYRSGGIVIAYQYTFDENEDGIPFLLFYGRIGDSAVYIAHAIVRGQEVWVLIYSPISLQATGLETLEEVLSTCRLTGE